MKRLYHFSVRTVRRSLILLIILSGLLIIAGRLLVPWAAEYRTDVEQWASQLLGQPVTIGQLKGDWRGLGPELVFYDLQLINKKTQKATLYLKEVRIALGLIDSLRQLKPVVRKVSFISPRLRITRQKSGAITIGNLDQFNELEPNDSSSAFLLPTHLQLIKGEIIWDDLTSDTPPLKLSDVDLKLRNGGTRHQLNGRITLPGKQKGTIELSIDMKGQLDRMQTWQARSFMQSRGIDLAFLLNRRIAKDYRFSNNQADVMLWGEWNQDGLVSLEGTTEWDQVAISRQSTETDQPASRLALDRVSGAVRIQRIENGWQMDLADLQIQREGSAWPKAAMGVVARKTPAGDWHIRAGSSRFRLEDMHAISTLFPGLGGPIEKSLKAMQARGSLDNLKIQYTPQGDAINWAASGSISAFNSKPAEGIPGIRNLPLSFWAGPEQGTLALNAQDVEVDFSGLFRDPLQLKKVIGELAWKRDLNGDIQLQTDQLFAENDDIHTVSRMRMVIPQSDEAPLFLDLQTDYWDGDALTTHRYLPAGIMGENVVAWLDRSIGEGHVTEGSVVVRGPLRDFPFDTTHTGRFEVFFNVENLKLDYWPEWPALKQLTADVRFLNNSFDTWASGGTILDSELQSAHARISDLALTSPLTLKGQVKGPFQDNLRLLTDSPLKEDFGPLVNGLKGEGAAQLDLAFSLPIDDGSPFKLDGKLGFQHATLHLADWELAIGEIVGDLQFDQDHIFASGITGNALGIPLKVDVSTPENNAQATRISAQARVSSKQWQAQLPKQAIEKTLSGQSRWTLDLDIPHLSAGPNAPVPMRVTSDLTGTQIKLPPPLGKTASEAWPFQLTSRIERSPIQRFDIHYNDQIKLALAVNKQASKTPQLTHVGVTLGGAEAVLPQRAGTEISGRINHLDLNPWVQPKERSTETTSLPPVNRVSLEIGQIQLDEKRSGETRLLLDRGETHWECTIISDWAEGGLLYPLSPDKATDLRIKMKQIQLDPWLSLLSRGTGETGEEVPGIQQISVSADKLSLNALAVSDFLLELDKNQTSWQGRYSSNRFNGTLVLPIDLQKEPIRLNLKQLNLTVDDSLLDQPQTEVKASGNPLDPTQLPALELTADTVTINEKPFGTLQVITQKRDDGLELQTASLNSDRIVLSATGSWLKQPDGNPNTRVDLALSSRDLGAVLKDLKFSDNLRDASVEIDSRLNWAGSPLDVSSKILNGQVGLQVSKGRFLKVDPGVGRLFGLFNLGALKRRLTLDFSDIFKKGFAFDAITGNFLLDSGDAYTNDFQMKGPSANIELSGRIGLGDEDFDSLISITPKISSSIPIAGAIAGGPAVGAALFLAQQLVGDSFDKVTQLQYLATGSWDNPVLTPKGRETAEQLQGPSTSPTAETESAEPDPTIDLEMEAVDTPETNETPAPSEATDPPAEEAAKTEKKPSRFFSRLLEKLKPTGPTYQQTSPDQ
ncbi:MAG: DUF3971 domain-containing protein [Sedimenticola sp.]|nr:DUF3971 domain-containing protein [Sedimenticola sp.]